MMTTANNCSNSQVEDFSLSLTAEEMDFSDLDMLLADIELEAAKKNKLKNKRVELARTQDDPELAAMLQREITAMELEQSYASISIVAKVNNYTCACGSTHNILDGFFHHTKHRTNGTLRWTRTLSPELYEDLPRSVEVNFHETEQCVHCLRELGFEW